MCELAYVTMLDALERQWHTSVVAMYARSAMSEEAPTTPSWGETKKQFDDYLLGEVAEETEEQRKLRLLGF